MYNDNSQIDKMLNQPIAQKILEFLAKEDLSIPQMSEKLHETDIQNIIAYFAELQRLGLIIPSSKEPFETKTEEGDDINDKLSEIVRIPRHEWFSSLGLGLPEYNALWEEISKKKGKSHPSVLDNLLFTVPEPLKDRFKKDNPESLSKPNT
jgi:hypothetical protein